MIWIGDGAPDIKSRTWTRDIDLKADHIDMFDLIPT
jgi:hypothetical protein